MPYQTLRDRAGFPQISYAVEGRGPVVVLLHGFPDNRSLWREIVPLLAEKFTVVCPDLPGAGKSSLPADGALSVESLAEAVAVIADEVADKPFTLVGHSMGGYAALAFAQKFRGRLNGMSLVHSTAVADDDEKKAQRQKAIVLIQKGGKEAFMKEAVPKMFSPKTKEARPDLIREQTERGLRLPDASAIAFYEAMRARPDRVQVLMNLAAPVQWILGQDDALIPLEKVLEQTHVAPVSQVKIYENVGHLAMVEAPERLAKDLAAFAHLCYQS